MTDSKNSRNQSLNSFLKSEYSLAICLIALIVACRWGIDLPNFKPVMAVAMFAGFIFSRQWLGLVTVVFGMVISDALIGFYEWPVAATVYVALVIPLLAGLIMKRWKANSVKLSTGVIGFAGLAALNFYLLTTLAVWGFFDWYPKSAGGLATAFGMGLPFLKWTLLGNVVFATGLFSLAALANQAGSLNRERKKPALAEAAKNEPH